MIDDIKPDMPSKEGGNSRRRLLRSALATPVVLSSLVSKPVLGAVPYQCTVSGQVSGNLSRSSDETVCAALGDSLATWLASTAWPTQITKGTAPDKNCAFNGQTVRGTNFNGFASGTSVLNSKFFNVAVGTGQNQACDVVTTSTTNKATMYQVLASTSTEVPFELGRTVVVSLLNAYQYPTTYPVTPAQIIAMFNATYQGGTYQVFDNPVVEWTRDQVVAYLKKLYPAV